MPIELSAQPERPRRPFVLTGRIVAAALVGFFLVVAGANATMLAMALRTMPGVEVRSAYETSQRFNGEIARMHRQAERGWQAQAEIRRDGEAAEIILGLRDPSGAAVSGLAVEARLQRPATRQEDRETRLTEAAPGQYRGLIGDAHAGTWTLALEARRDGEIVFTSRSRVFLKD